MPSLLKLKGLKLLSKGAKKKLKDVLSKTKQENKIEELHIKKLMLE